MWDLLIASCAVDGAPPAVVAQIIRVESAGDPFAIHVNADDFSREDGETVEAVVARATALGYSVDLGLMQINSRHLDTSGLSVDDAMEPCANIRLGSDIFMRGYRPALAFYGDTPLARKAALSAYNTGTFHRGFANGYVGRYADGLAAAPSAVSAVDSDPHQSDTRIDVTFGEGRSSSQVSDGDQRGGSGR